MDYIKNVNNICVVERGDISGSMEPAISVNDMVVVCETDDYQIGDVISFKSDRSVVTHRIVEITTDGYLTKGDANNTVDFAPVDKDDIVGMVMYTIPRIGILLGYLQTPLGMTCLVLLGVLLIEIPYLLDKSRTRRRGRFL